MMVRQKEIKISIGILFILFLEDLTDDDIQISFKNLITNSVTYMMLKRCDIDPSKYYDRNNFSDI